MKVLNYNFAGPHTTVENLLNRSGVYLIVDQQKTNNVLVDVGESSEVKNRIENHDRKSCWNQNCVGKLTAYVLYTPGVGQLGRISIEKKIRDGFNPLCGKQ